MKRRLQVFVSSTFTDLIEERQAAVSAILKAGHIPAGMELFTAGDRSQMMTIKEWIDESDVYMLILGGRYGSIERSSGVSYTELEYDYASEQGKAMFAVVTSEVALENKIRAHGTSFGEKDNQRELALFRQKVLSNISSFFDDQKDIKLCVHESLADFASNRDLKGWVSGDEILDTKPLFDEIKKLSDENRSLKEVIDKLEKRVFTAPTANPPETLPIYDEIKQVLQAIDVKVPAAVYAGDEDITNSLFDIFYQNKELLINGVTNAANSSVAESFLYHNVCPKLQVHGLTSNEKVTGARYRRSFVSAKGNAFLAQTEKSQFASRTAAQAIEAAPPLA